MMRYVALAAVCVVLLHGCAKDLSAFVLVPDAEGRVGEATITNKAGTVVLANDRDSTWVRNENTQFTGVAPMPEEQVDELFISTMAAQPDPPAHFLLYFEDDATTLLPDSQPLLANVIAEIRKRDSRDISIVGHADRKGDDAYNVDLSLRRARTILDALLNEKVDPADVLVESHGENNPIVKTEDGVAEPRNRRVEVIVR